MALTGRTPPALGAAGGMEKAGATDYERAGVCRHGEHQKHRPGRRAQVTRLAQRLSGKAAGPWGIQETDRGAENQPPPDKNMPQPSPCTAPTATRPGGERAGDAGPGRRQHETQGGGAKRKAQARGQASAGKKGGACEHTGGRARCPGGRGVYKGSTSRGAPGGSKYRRGRPAGQARQHVRRLTGGPPANRKIIYRTCKPRTGTCIVWGRKRPRCTIGAAGHDPLEAAGL